MKDFPSVFVGYTDSTRTDHNRFIRLPMDRLIDLKTANITHVASNLKREFNIRDPNYLCSAGDQGTFKK